MPASKASTVARSLSVSSTCTVTSKPRPTADGIDVGVVAADHAGLLERAHAAQARGRREPHALGELDVREPPVRLELTQDCAIECIHGQIMPQIAVMDAEVATNMPPTCAYRCGMSSTAIAQPPDRTLSGAAGIGIAVGVYGVSFGVLAVAAGLSPAQACVMSLLVFTGASQFAFVGVLAAGGGRARGDGAGGDARRCATRPTASRSRRSCRAGSATARSLAQLVIDESTAMARAQDDPATARRAFLATGVSVWVCWNAGTLAGALLGGGLGDPRALGLDAMFPAAFLALLAPQLRRRARPPPPPRAR